jgi:hypothetical protein
MYMYGQGRHREVATGVRGFYEILEHGVLVFAYRRTRARNMGPSLEDGIRGRR